MLKKDTEKKVQKFYTFFSIAQGLKIENKHFKGLIFKNFDKKLKNKRF